MEGVMRSALACRTIYEVRPSLHHTYLHTSSKGQKRSEQNDPQDLARPHTLQIALLLSS